ncbi:MAG TPA: DUF1698 domain-containing protein [Caulobacteraceae bacterium]
MTDAIRPEDVELANAYGPYTHGVWRGSRAVVGNEEALAGRHDFLAAQIRRRLLERFSADEMRGMTLVDVGCYDGWLLCQLEDLPFGRMIGVEPRRKNLEKGRTIRRLLGVETRVEFHQAGIDDLNDVLGPAGADVVICIGVMHHLASTAQGVAALRAACRRFLFIETMCLAPELESDDARAAMELKDLPYLFGEHEFGLIGAKFESSYSDGSATQPLSVVTVPSASALKMFLRVNGFGNIEVVSSPEDYAQIVPGGWRRFVGVCMCADAVPDSPDGTLARWIDTYESGLIKTLLPPEVAAALYARHSGHPSTTPASGELARLAAEADDPAAALAQALPGQHVQEILKNIRHAPHDKSALEHGKCLLAGGRHDEGRSVLLEVTRHLNADWRAVYRAFCLLGWSFRVTGDTGNAKRYADLCLMANPQFPPALLEGDLFGAFEPAS